MASCDGVIPKEDSSSSVQVIRQETSQYEKSKAFDTKHSGAGNSCHLYNDINERNGRMQ